MFKTFTQYVEYTKRKLWCLTTQDTKIHELERTTIRGNGIHFLSFFTSTFPDLITS